jgi:hypothetical protein
MWRSILRARNDLSDARRARALRRRAQRRQRLLETAQERDREQTRDDDR